MNKEEIKKQLKEEMNKQIDEFVDTLSDELTKEKFNMSNVENAIGNSLNNYQSNIMNTTERLFNSRLETDLISKKKSNWEEKGYKLENRGKRNISLILLYGKINITRTILRIEEKLTEEEMEKLGIKSREIIPYDEYLEIDNLEFKISKEAMVEIAFWGQNQNSYRQAQAMLEKYRNILIGTDTVLKVTEYVGKIVYKEDDRQAQENYNNIANIATVEKEKTQDILYGSIDGSAVNTRIEDENGSTWKENKLGMLFSKKDLYQRKDKSNMITKKEFTSIFGGVQKFKEHFFNMALKHDYLSYKKVIFITDGATWIRNMLNELFPDAIQILDKFHLLENIGDYAKAVFKDNERKVKNFVERTFERIVNKEFNLIYSELKKYKDMSLPNGTVNLETYIKNNENKMDYRYYESQGWFVGSGSIESSNKTVVQRRTKQPGMRWSVDGGQFILTLRAKEESGLWIDEVKNRVLAFC